MDARTVYTPRGLLALVAAAATSGCLMGDPPPDPEVQPLEIIAGNPDPDSRPCLLNVEEVGAGVHEVTPLAMQGTATVRIVDPSGVVLFERVVTSHPAPGGGHEVPLEDGGSVRLRAGAHRVECIMADGTHTVALRVVPARPGYEQ